MRTDTELLDYLQKSYARTVVRNARADCQIGTVWWTMGPESHPLRELIDTAIDFDEKRIVAAVTKKLSSTS